MMITKITLSLKMSIIDSFQQEKHVNWIHRYRSPRMLSPIYYDSMFINKVSGQRLSSREISNLSKQVCFEIMRLLINSNFKGDKAVLYHLQRQKLLKVEAMLMWYLDTLGQIETTQTKELSGLSIHRIALHHITLDTQCDRYLVVKYRSLDCDSVCPFFLVKFLSKLLSNCMDALISTMKDESEYLVARQSRLRFDDAMCEIKQVMESCQVRPDANLEPLTIDVCFGSVRDFSKRLILHYV